jgi:cyclase
VNPEIDNFCKIIKTFTKECFIPISAGGKITSLEIAKKYIQSGADKLVINSNLFNKILINKIAKTFGRTMYCRIIRLFK